MKRCLLLFVAPSLLLAGLAYHFVPPQPRCVLEGDLGVLGISADGARLATIGRDCQGPLRVCDTRTGVCLVTAFGDERNLEHPIVDDHFRIFACSTDERRFLFADLESGRTCKSEVIGFGNDILRSGGLLRELANTRFSKLANHLIVDGMGLLPSALLDTTTGKSLVTFPAKEFQLIDELVRDDNACLMRLVYDDNLHFDLHLMDIATRKYLHSWEKATAHGTAPDGRKIIVAQSLGEPGLAVWDLDALKELGRIPVPHSATRVHKRFSFSPDSRTLVFGHFHGGEPRERASIWNLAMLAEVGQVDLGADGLSDVAYAPDGKSAVLMTNRAPTMFVFVDLATRTERWRWRAPGTGTALSDPQFSRDGTSLVVGLTQLANDRDPTAWCAIASISMANGEAALSWRQEMHKNLTHYVVPHRNRRYEIQTFRTQFGDESWWRKLLNRVLTKRPVTEMTTRLIDFDSQREIAQVNDVILHDKLSSTKLNHFMVKQGSFLSADGRTWVTQHGRMGAARRHQLRVWDVPQRTPWGWVLGPPLAWCAASAAWLAWRRRAATAK